MQPQPPVNEGYGHSYSNQYAEPAPSSTPSLFTPGPPDTGMSSLAAPGPMSNYSGLASAPAPSLTGHIPDQPSPGFTPSVSNGSGWNDPPPMMISKSNQKTEPTVSPSDPAAAPITQPLYGSAAPEPAPPAGPGAWAGFQPAPPTSSAPAPSYGQQTVPGYQGFTPAQPAPPVSQAPAPPPEEATPPAPIPAEHQVIQDTLESLRSKCVQGKSFIDCRK